MVPRDILPYVCNDYTDIFIVDYLVRHGADVRAIDVHGNTSMHYVPSLSRYLIDNGGDVHHVNNEGYTVLHILSSRKCQYWQSLDEYDEVCTEMITTFVTVYGADVNARSSDGSTPLDVAYREESRTISNILQDLGASRSI